MRRRAKCRRGHAAIHFSKLRRGEGGGQANVTVSRSAGPRAVSVQYATSDGTATAGSDYTAASGTLNWADGDGADKFFMVTLTNDSLMSRRDNQPRLVNATGGAVIGVPSSKHHHQR